MIRNEAEYQEALRRLRQDEDVATRQREALAAAGLKADEIERAMQPLLSFHAQLEDEIAWYEAVRRGNLPTIHQMNDVGRLLIALRIFKGISQRDLAERLGVSESVVSRDERNEYHGISVDRVQKILNALGAAIVMSVDEPSCFPIVDPERAAVAAEKR
ncbi:MAG TPA: helix-turn-helix domain-containing protein [Chloroflexota bacterium]|nr:helix-turn-helix domain-containing protein [Chloroflexota bacterium]